MLNPLDEVVRRQKAGEAVGITSICSAHPLVLEAAMLQASDDGSPLACETATRCGLPLERVVLGGDHLGPNRWRHLPPDEAMQHADVLIEAYVAAGFTKLHLGRSFPCAGDPTPLTDDLVARRAARMMRVAEDTAAARGAAGTLRM